MQEINPIALLAPLMTKELFAEHSGLRVNQIRGQAERDNLPIIKLGRLSLVNVARLSTHLDGAAYILCPTMTAQRFAMLSGLTKGQVETQISEANIPSKRVGRLVLVDVSELYRRCLYVKPELIASH